MLVSQLIKAAYLNLGAVDIEDDPTPAQYAQGLLSLNSMIAAWSRERMTLYGLFDESFTLTPGKGEYTVGIGGELDTAWPFLIESAFIRDANGTDYPLQIVTQGQYDSLTIKTTESRPEYLLYNPKGYPTGTMTLFFVPDAAYALFWTAQKVITAYASIEDSVGIAPEYEEALEYSLTMRLAPKCGVDLSRELAMLAASSKSVIPLAVEPAEFDGAFNTGGRYSIYSDTL